MSRQMRSVDSRAGEVSHLRAFYGWAHDRDMIERDPTNRLSRPRLPRRLPRPMPDEEFARAIDLAPDYIAPWLYLAGYAGLRCCEIALLTGEDYLRGSGILVLREMKGGDQGAVPVSPDLAVVLDPLPAFGIWFPRPDGRPGAINASQVSAHANQYLHSIGIESTMHSLRHWFGSHVYRASGRDIRLTQELLRHRSPSSTAVYVWVDQREASNIVAQLPRLA